VKCDGDGLIPESLESILRNWETDQPNNHPRPKVLYTIPTGSNPTGASLSVERKRKIYSIASEFNLLILEDDPYYWMQYDEEKEEKKKTEEESSRNTSSSYQKQQRAASFMSMDVEGRVLRFDSFSKLLSSGIRVGFVTGPPALIERIEYHAQASVLHSSAVSQALVAGLFDHWKEQSGGISSYNGFVDHCYGITEFYRLRRNNFVKSARKHLNGLVEFTVPSAGMFCWMKFLDVEDADQFIKEKARDAKVLLVPGQSFDPLNRVSPWARAAYSTASAEDMDVALERLGELLREQKNLKTKV
jgi:kynurenine/2-aminoadipate aminotransferase